MKFDSKFKALLSDTVGFIRKLPPGLVASFRTTLAEIREADCILHVIDLASPSCKEQMAEVEKIFEEMDIKNIPRINVFNKVDAVEDEYMLGWGKREYPDAIFISATKGIHLEELKKRLWDEFAKSMVDVSVSIKVEDGKKYAEIHEAAEILERKDEDGKIDLKIRLPKLAAKRILGR
jgi:GTP-binding protein HflX